jgi:hypothetical protein
MKKRWLSPIRFGSAIDVERVLGVRSDRGE